MNVMTIEGLAGASVSASLIATPMNIAKEAERKGDTDKMQRALGYAGELKDQAEDYTKKAHKGMEEDAKEAKKQEELRQEQLAEAIRQERQEQEKRLRGEEQGESGSFDSVEISQEGKIQPETGGYETADACEDVIYDQSGENVELGTKTGEYVDVSA